MCWRRITRNLIRLTIVTVMFVQALSGFTQTQRVVFEGLVHQALGQAQLHVDNLGHLVLGNIGATGDDGVRINLGRSDGLHWSVELPAEPVPYQIISAGNNLAFKPVGQGYALTPDFSGMGAKTYELRLYLEGKVVHIQPGMSGLAARVEQVGAEVEFCCHFDAPSCSWHFVQPSPVDVQDGPTVVADFLVVAPENPDVIEDVVLDVQVRAAPNSTTELAITAEYLMMFGTPNRMANPHRALGGARAVALNRNGHLVLGNIGASGDDGVSIDLDAVAPFIGLPEIKEAEIDVRYFLDNGGVARSATTATVQVAFWFVSDSSANELPIRLEFLKLLQLPNRVLARADFSAIQPKTLFIEVYDGGQLVARFSPLADEATWTFTALGEDLLLEQVSTTTRIRDGLSNTIMIGEVLPAPVTIKFLNRRAVVGDEVRFVAGGINNKLRAVAEIKLTGSNLGRFDIVGETVRAVNHATVAAPGSRILNILPQKSKVQLQPQPPSVTQAFANFPNPFNPETWMPFANARDNEVHIQIYDVGGHHIRSLDLGHKPAGYYLDRSRAAYWDGRNELGEVVPGGVYFYTLKAGNYQQTRKMVVVK